MYLQKKTIMNRICAGIVLYYPNSYRLKQNIESIIGQVEKVFIVNNGSDDSTLIESLLSEFPKVDIRNNPENLGIATALNQLCETAKQEGFSWIVTLDQDTVCPPDMISKMKKYLSKEYGIICPAVHYEGTPVIPLLDSVEFPYACMTSASLTQIEAWERVGEFNDSYFIDFVDNEFCMKLKIHEYQILRVNSCAIEHQLGEKKIIKLFGIIPKTFYAHNDLRIYYMVRNNYIFINTYKKHLNILKEYCKLAYIISINFLYSTNKKNTMRSIRDGISDAKKHRGGKKL